MSEARPEETPPSSPKAAAPARDPEAFGKYWLIDRIAIGGMAEVFRTKAFGHAGFEKDLVVKRILRHYSRDPEFVEMFISEAKLCAQLVHPNIVQVFDFGKIENNYFIAMELVDGKDLKSLMRRQAERKERLPVALATYVAFEVAKGLDYAHTRTDAEGLPLNLVHRDVSPSNLLLGYDGHVKLVDFGIAEVESERERANESAVLKGKFSYMCPEQVAQRALDARADQFSLGICLWEMLTGHRLFKAETEPATLARIRECDVPPPRNLNPDVPNALEDVCLRMLEPDPADRYPDVASLAEALGDALPGTAERARMDFSAFLRERFADEIAQERERMEAGTKLAAQWHYDGGDLDLDLEEDDGVEPGVPVAGPEAHADSTETFTPVQGSLVEPEPATQRRSPLLFVLPLLLFAALVLSFVMRPTVPVDGTLSVAVLPSNLDGVVLTLDGVEIDAEHPGVAPEVPHTLRVTAPGHLPRERSIELVAGQTFAVEITLSRVEPDLVMEDEPELPGDATTEPSSKASPKAEAKKPEPKAEEPKAEEPKAEEPKAEEPEAVAAALPPIVYFRSDPPGADVVLDGKVLGNAPLEWRDGETGRGYPVEFRLDGHDTVKARVTTPKAGASVVVSRRLPAEKPPVAAAGKLNVQITPGWAKVYVDGEYVSTTPLIGHELPSGTHELRVLSERLGIDQTESVTVKGGETTVKAYSFDR